MLKKLPKEKWINKLFYTQVKRTEKVAMYDIRLKPGDTITGYEVFIIKIRKAEIVVMPNGRKLECPLRECFQPNGLFGRYAWSILKREKAEEAFNKLVEYIPIKAIQQTHNYRKVLGYD